MQLDGKTHIPVLMEEVLLNLNPEPGKVYIGVTLGGGGHTRAILNKELNCKVIGFDWDKNVIDTIGQELAAEFGDRFVPVLSNFAKIEHALDKINVEKVDGILADFGTSQIQIKNTPGFSVYNDTFLDMRFNPGMSTLRAYDVVNNFDQEELEQIFFQYGDESHGRKIARAILHYRKNQSIKTTAQLAALVKEVVPGGYHKIHPATKVFQALRIFVNKELENIQTFLQASLKVLNPGGKLVCISFHSLEDRLVKQFFKEHSSKQLMPGFFKMLTKGACMATDQELQQNKSARSARLRAGILQ